jgi:hypothetical protein
VRPITKEIFGGAGPDHLRAESCAGTFIIDVASFRTGDLKNAPTFSVNPVKQARLGVFACRKDKVERAAILLLPATGVPDRVIIGITHRFSPQTKFFDRLGWANPLSRDLIQDVTKRFALFRWGSQILESKKKTSAMLLFVRAKGDELGPFGSDGKFVKHVLTAISGLTNDAFVPRNVEAFTFSSGITDLNRFLAATAGVLNMVAIYNQDPAPTASPQNARGAVVRQFASGIIGPFAPGFEPLPLARWVKEPFFARRQALPLFRNNDALYLHDHCIGDYTLFLGIQQS